MIKFGIVFVLATLYSLGGMEDGGGKWLRRYLYPIILSGGMFYFSRDWKCFLSLPLMFGSLSLGYGADTDFLKIIKRGIYGLANATSTGLNFLLSKRWLLLGIQFVLVVGTCITLGVWNPLPDARTEEFCLGALISFFPIMGAKKKSLHYPK